jgi:hypothetical protein
LFPWDKKSQKCGYVHTSFIFTVERNENNHPKGENSSNLVTLTANNEPCSVASKVVEYDQNFQNIIYIILSLA